MQEWLSEEWDTVNAAHENTGALVYSYCYIFINCYSEDAGLHYQIGILKNSLCHLCALWQGSVPVVYSPRYVPYGFHGIGMDSIWNGDLIVKIYQVLYGFHGIIPPGIHGLHSMDSTWNPYGMIFRSC